MHSLITIFSYAAILLALGPLLLLAIYALANRAGWRIADRLFKVLVRVLVVQAVIASLINLSLGVALIGLCIWAMGQPSLRWGLSIGVMTIGLGSWRAWRGAVMLWGWHQSR